MKLQTKTVELRILTASAGMVLTDGETYSSVGGEVYLGVNDNPDNWYEITEEQALEKINMGSEANETDI